MKKLLLILTLCIFSSSLLYSQNIDVTIDAYQPNCPGEYTYIYANVTISSNYTISWSNGSTTYYNYVNAGTYTVIVTDITSGDTAMATAVIVDPPGLSLTAVPSLIYCHGASDGNINLTVTGNTAPYSYSWSNGSSNQDLYNVPAGIYSVMVSDINYCNYSLDSIEVTELPAVDLIMSPLNATCGMSDGSVTVSTGSATGTFYFLWDDPNSSTSPTADNLSAGIYHVTVTSDQGCITYGTGIVDNIGAPFLIPYYTNIMCNGNNTGNASVSVQGGVSPFTFLWSNNDTLSSTDSLFAGPIDVVVTDANGCQSFQSFNLTEPPALNAILNKNNVPCYPATVNNGGNMWVTVDGGVPNYTFNWSNNETTSEVYSLMPGVYTVTVSDMNGCTVILSDTILDAVPITLDTVVTNPLCAGGWNGSIDLTVAGGTPPYNYFWSGQSYSSDEDRVDIPAGFYNLSVNDMHGCYVYATITLTDPPAMNTSAVVTDVVCYNDSTGAIDLSVNNGTAPYSFLWSQSIGASKLINSNNSLLTSGFTSTDEDLVNVPSGWYYIQVTDASGCIYNNSYYVNNGPFIGVSLSSFSEPQCGASDGLLNVNIYGGYVPYSYNWSNGDTTVFADMLAAGPYSLTVTDSMGCAVQFNTVLSNMAGSIPTFYPTGVSCYGLSDGAVSVSSSAGDVFQWSNDSTSSTMTGLSAGTYTLTITDVSGCITISSVSIYEPEQINISFSTSNPYCSGDSTGYISAYATGGSWEFSYLWSNDSTFTYLNNLPAGTYTLTVTDMMYPGCQKVDSVVITEPPPIVVNGITVSNLTCYGYEDGTITIDASAGGEQLEYSLNQSGFSPSNVFTGQFAGIHNLVIRYATNYYCEFNYPDAIVITEPEILSGSFEQTNSTCYGANNGTITFIPSGGTTPYEYSIDGEITFGSDSLKTNLAPGFYPLKIKDANGCLYKPGDAMLSEPNNININISGSTLNCFGDANGHANMTVSGGFPPYTFIWSNGSIVQNISNLSANTYTVTVTDSHNCNYIDSTIVDGPSAIQINSVTTNTLCSGSSDGTIDLTISGGTPSYSYIWNDNAVTEDRLGLAAGTYVVTVTDFNNCTSTNSIIVSQPALLTSTVSTTSATCNGTCDGTATVTPSGGVGSYTYLWGTVPATTTSTVTVCAGVYSVSVSDANGCIVTNSASVSEPETISLTTSSTLSACNICNGTATVIPAGGTSPYDYVWTNNDISSVADSLCAGTFVVTVTDINGCTDFISVDVTAQPFSVITGEAHWSGGTITDNTSEVQLYKIINTTQAELAYTSPLSGSQFTFSDIAYGQYFVKVDVLNGVSMPQVLSTYLDSTHLWELADTVNVGCATTYNLHIPMYEMTQPVGPEIGVISGYITYADYPGGGKGITATEDINLQGEPVPGAEIYVELEPDDEPIMNTTTNDTGFYFVSGLEGGNTYSLSVDIPGLPMITTYTNININGDSTTYTQMNFYVDTSSTNGGIFIGSSSSIVKHENEIFNVEMYPNPFSDYININYQLNKPGKVNLEIFDIQGKVVAVLVNEKQREGDYKYEFNALEVNLSEGTYIVKLQVDNSVFIKKMLQVK